MAGTALAPDPTRRVRRMIMLSFPPFRLDLDNERLWKNGEEIRVRRKPFAILRHLVQHPQRLVSHEEIIEVVWGKIATSESLLRTHLSEVRQALGEGVVETVVGRGYRFLPEVKRLDSRVVARRCEHPGDGKRQGRRWTRRRAGLAARGAPVGAGSSEDHHLRQRRGGRGQDDTRRCLPGTSDGAGSGAHRLGGLR